MADEPTGGLTLGRLLRMITGAGGAEGHAEGEGPPAARPGPTSPPPRTMGDFLRRASVSLDNRATASLEQEAANRSPPTPMPDDVIREVRTLGGRPMTARQPSPPPPTLAGTAVAALDPLGLASMAPQVEVDLPVHTLRGREQGLTVPVRSGVPRPTPSDQLAGAMVTPWSQILRKGTAGVQALGRTATAHPRVAGGATLAAAASPSEANPPIDPTRGPQPRGIGREILDTLGFGSGQGDSQQPLTQDEFLQARRRLQPRTESDYIESEVARVRDNDRWQTGGRALRTNLEEGARANARAAYAGYQRSVADETARLSREYAEVYRPGWERQRAEMLSKPFVARHPGVATALTVGGPLIAGLVTHSVANKVNQGLGRAGQSTIDAALANNARETAVNAVGTQNRLRHAPWATYGAAAKMAMLPAELRAGGDFIDARALPPDAPARLDAERRMSNMGDYLRSFGQDVASGGVAAATGLATAKLRRSASGPATAETGASYLAGIDTARMSPDQIASVIAQRAARATAQQSRATQAHAQLAGQQPAQEGGWSLGRLLRSGFGRAEPPPTGPPLLGGPPTTRLPPPADHHSYRQPREHGRFSGPPRQTDD